jgi:hypothetical protein
VADYKFLMAEAGRTAAPKVTLSESALPSKMWYVATLQLGLYSILPSNSARGGSMANENAGSISLWLLAFQ